MIHEQHPFSTARFERSYAVAGSTLTVRFGDITTSQADVLASSDDYLLSMGGGVSRSILNAGGRSIAVDAAKWTPLARGDVAVTGAGALPARFVFHVVTIGPSRDSEDPWSDTGNPIDPIRQATRRCIALARQLDARSIAFPSLGSGVAGLPIESVAAAMAEAIAAELGEGAPLQIEMYLAAKSWQDSSDYLGFFEQFAALQHVARELPTSAPTVEHQLSERASTLLESERVITGLEQQLTSATEAERPTIAAELAAATTRSAETIEFLRPVQLFVSYAREDLPWAQVLINHLSGLRHAGLAVWSDQMIEPGARWEPEILHRLDSADFAVFLMSASFLGSTYCVDVEWAKARERADQGNLQIMPVILSASMWQPLVGDFQVVPPNALPILSHDRTDEAFLSVVSELAQQIKKWQVTGREGSGDTGRLSR
jgi:O-acetyl-ADP-ribose deacetylase (regulator of RNase III)